jgi:3-oxoadipate enol-lactonase
MAAVWDAVVSRFLSEGFRPRHPETVRQIGEMIEATSPIGYMGACAALRDTNLREMIPAIHTPSLILAGALDESTPPSQARALHTAIVGSELVILQEAAHLSNVEQPGAFSTYFLGFLTSP